MKKLSLLLAAVLLFAVCACDGTPPEPQGFDYGSLPFYTADADSLPYSYTEEERVRPFWLGNVMYNETAMFVEEGDTAVARTMFEPEKIIAVRDWTLTKQYEEGKDYTVAEDGTLVRTAESAIPVFQDSWAYGIDMPSGFTEVDGNNVTGNNYRLFDCMDSAGNPVKVTYTEGPLVYENYVHITYVYDPADFGYDAVKSDTGELSALTEKLEAGEDIDMAVFGDSISEGCSSSKHWGRAPQCPFYGELVKDEIERIYGVTVNMTNMSLGGKTSAWGAGTDTSNNGGYNLTKLRSLKTDFLIIGFGMNDAGVVPAEEFTVNIGAIADAARAANPDCQIVFLNSYPGNEYFVSRSRQKAIGTAYREFSYLYAGAAYVDLYDLGLKMLEHKRYYEISANNVNHPNDFMHRVYAMNILASFVDYAKEAL